MKTIRARARFTTAEEERLSTCRFVSFFVAPTGPALISYSLMLADREFFDAADFVEPVVFLGNWALASLVAGGAMFALQPIPAGQWWKVILAAMVAVPAYYLSFALIAISGHQLGFRL